MITTIEKETTKQYKSLNEDLKNEVLKKSKLDKPDYSLQRFNVITKEVYYKNFVRTNLGIIKTTLDSYLNKEDYTKEDCLEVASFAKTIHDFIQQTPEFKRLVELNTKKEVKKPTTKKIVKKKNPILGNDLIKELGLDNYILEDDDLF
jgi:hypothetical protein